MWHISMQIFIIFYIFLIPTLNIKVFVVEMLFWTYNLKYQWHLIHFRISKEEHEAHVAALNQEEAELEQV